MIIGLLLTLLIPYIAYRYITSKNKLKNINGKALVKSTLIGTFLCTLIIIILELLFDRIYVIEGKETLYDSFVESFFRAGLIEEAIKLIFSYICILVFKAKTRSECMLVAGCIGLGYSISEKLATGNMLSMLINSFIMLHVLFQFINGYFIYDALNNKNLFKKNIKKAFYISFLLHGLWDFVISVCEYVFKNLNKTYINIGVALIIIMIIMGLTIEVISIRKVKRILDEEYM